IVLPIDSHDLIKPLKQFPIIDRKTDLYPPEEISGRPIRTREIDLGFPGVFKTIDSAVLKKPAGDAANSQMLAHSWHPRAQATNAPDQQVDLYPGLGCLIQRFDDRFVDQSVYLDENRRRLTHLRVVQLASDHFN